MRLIFKTIMLVALMLLASCNHGRTDDAATRHADSLLSEVNDSILVNSPKASAMAKAGMRNAADSIEYYGYVVALGKIYYMSSKTDSMRQCVNRALSFVNRTSEPTPRHFDLKANAYGVLATDFYHKRQADSAIVNFHLSYIAMMHGNNLGNLPAQCANLADAYEQKNDMAQAANWYRRALFLTDSLRLPHSTYVSLYLGLAQVYMNLHDFENSQYYYRQTEKSYNDLTPNLKFYFLNNYASFYYYSKEYGKSLVLFRRLQAMVKDNPDMEFDLNLCRLNMADVFFNLGQNDSARYYLKITEPYFVAQNVQPAIYYGNTVKIGLALADNDVARVRCILAAEKFPPPDEPNLRDIRRRYMRSFFIRTGDYKNAYSNLLYSTNQNDSIEHSRAHILATEIMMRYQQDTLALHNSLRIENEVHKTDRMYLWLVSNTAVAVVLLLAVIIGVIMVRRRAMRNEMKLLRSRLDGVRSRISPHFIFNVLNHEASGEVNSENLQKMAKLMRTNLELSRQTYITLKAELDFVKQYVDAEKSLLGKEFKYSVEVPADSELEKIIVPSMAVQILVENSIKHGLLQKGGKRELCIRVVRNADSTDIFVEDNGTGFTMGGSSSGVGLGLNIIRQTILIVNQNNKKKVRFEIHNRVENDAIVGCVAHFMIPDGLKFMET
ncbi:MAG: histidine kinase [Muribaculaceae bacterium]|jgi:tetratricopeptide (TPR) repeat protein|nr:histidine kinase [Muribaculaceae bacterium]